MSDRHDLRRQSREIHEALSRFERDQLVDILTHVFRIYVMEGAALAPPPTTAIGDELAGLSFAQVIERLQLRLDLPELQLFEVQGGRVNVRIDGRLQPLEIPTGRPEAPARSAPPPAAPPPPASPGVERQELRQDARPAAPAAPGVMPAPAGHASSPRPEANARPPAGRATSASVASAAAARAAGPAEKSAAAPAPAPAKPAEKPADDSSQGGRFGLLEID